MTDTPYQIQLEQVRQSGARLPTKKETVQTELQRIWDERGRLRVGDIVDDARDETSPLHEWFDWDDTSAAERFREVQARALIHLVKLRVTSVDASGMVNDYQVRGWVAARQLESPAGSPDGYVPLELVQSNPKARDALLRQMARDAQAFRRRYQHLAEYTSTVEALLGEEAEAS